MLNIINTSEYERKSEIDSACTTFETTISKNYRKDRIRRVKSEKKTLDLSVIWVDTLKSMIQDESYELAKQEIPGCVKIATEVEIECIF